MEESQERQKEVARERRIEKSSEKLGMMCCIREQEIKGAKRTLEGESGKRKERKGGPRAVQRLKEG